MSGIAELLTGAIIASPPPSFWKAAEKRKKQDRKDKTSFENIPAEVWEKMPFGFRYLCYAPTKKEPIFPTKPVRILSR